MMTPSAVGSLQSVYTAFLCSHLKSVLRCPSRLLHAGIS